MVNRLEFGALDQVAVRLQLEAVHLDAGVQFGMPHRIEWNSTDKRYLYTLLDK